MGGALTSQSQCRLACAKGTLFARAALDMRKLVDIAVVRSLAVCAARDDNIALLLRERRFGESLCTHMEFNTCTGKF